MDIQAIILDDEMSGIINLKSLLKEFCPNISIINTASTIEELSRLIQYTKFDLAFLDVQIGTEKIFNYLKKLNKVDFYIIFISAHNHALEAFKYDAIDYLLKPIDIDKLIASINRVESHFKNKATTDNSLKKKDEVEKIAFPTSDGYQILSLSDIIYCRAEGSYTEIHLHNEQKIVSSHNLKYHELLLPKDKFYRIHHSSLVNLEHIKRIYKNDGGYVFMSNNDRLSISKSKKESLYNMFNL